MFLSLICAVQAIQQRIYSSRLQIGADANVAYRALGIVNLFATTITLVIE